MKGATMSTDAVRAYLRTLRERRGLTQEAVADALGMQRVNWGRYEKGRNQTMSSDLLLAAMRVLGGSFRDLKDLAGDNADEAMGAMLAIRRAERIAAGELSAYEETAGTDELNQLLAEIEQFYREAAEHPPSFLGWLRRRLPGGGGPRP